ncbi:MAG: IS21 family transposase [Chloroflexi bacterium]|nr:MAG: IS21 family transposase [Chloroflexota bacterium]
MYQVAMYTTIQTLLSQGKSDRWIAQHLSINRRTVKKIREDLAMGLSGPEVQERPKKLTNYEEVIKGLLKKGLSGQLIWEELVTEHDVAVSYATVKRYVRTVRPSLSNAYVPILTDPGEEAQVDFGELGYFGSGEKRVRVWVFCMILSYSRYAYYEIVTDQRVETFIRCHIHAFEFFGGVPHSIKLDNLKAGVIHPDFYQPELQAQYADFLAHYGSIGMPARVAYPEEKGNVESGVKYVKGNFLPRFRPRIYANLPEALRQWTREICNKRLHGTTRKVPQGVFEAEEKATLLSLPAERYEIYRIEKRKVNRVGHITFQGNYYSVPYIYLGQRLIVQSNGKLLRVFEGLEEVALHPLASGKGQYITREEHKPPHKRHKSRCWYLEELQQIGPDAEAFFEALEAKEPRHWQAKIRGIIHLTQQYESEVVNLACRRALHYQALTYLAVKNICQKGLYQWQEQEPLDNLGGYGQELQQYDQLDFQYT